MGKAYTREADAGALAHKIEVAEACGGVVTLRIEEARLLKDAILQRAALAGALETLVRGLPGASDTDYQAPPALKAAVDAGRAALRAAGRLP